MIMNSNYFKIRLDDDDGYGYYYYCATIYFAATLNIYD